MRFSDVKERYVYYVYFNPIQGNEFKGSHMALVLKKNLDMRTAVVMPLSSNSSGQGANKILLPLIQSLPKRLQSNPSYAVYDQVRTVDFKRFTPFYKEGGQHEPLEVCIDDDIFTLLVDLGSQELEKNLLLDEKFAIYRKKFSEIANAKIINLAYEIKRTKEDAKEVERIKNEIRGIIYNSIEYKFTDIDKENGIENIINSILGK